MTERPHSREQSDWLPNDIADAVGAASEPQVDHILGTGVRFHLGSPPGTHFELFPDAGIVRIATPDVHIALVRQPPPVIEPTGIVFSRATETSSSHLTIAPDGAVTLTLTPGFKQPIPVAAPKTPADTSLSAERSIDQVGSDKPVSDDAVTPEAAPSDPVDSGSTSETQPRTSLRGRLGSAPRFRTTPKEVLIARFPLAVYVPETDSTTWHKIVAFGERALRLQADELRKGELVSVVGYEHERTVTDKAGNERKEVELFAAVIKRA